MVVALWLGAVVVAKRRVKAFFFVVLSASVVGSFWVIGDDRVGVVGVGGLSFFFSVFVLSRLAELFAESLGTTCQPWECCCDSACDLACIFSSTNSRRIQGNEKTGNRL